MTSRALTIGLPVHRRRALVVGGEAAALRQVGALREAGAIITVVALAVGAAIEDLAERGQLDWRHRNYLPGDLDDAWLVLACTGRAHVHQVIAADAESRRIFCVLMYHGAPAQPTTALGRVVLIGGLCRHRCHAYSFPDRTRHPERDTPVIRAY